MNSSLTILMLLLIVSVAQQRESDEPPCSKYQSNQYIFRNKKLFSECLVRKRNETGVLFEMIAMSLCVL